MADTKSCFQQFRGRKRSRNELKEALTQGYLFIDVWEVDHRHRGTFIIDIGVLDH